MTPMPNPTKTSEEYGLDIPNLYREVVEQAVKDHPDASFAIYRITDLARKAFDEAIAGKQSHPDYTKKKLQRLARFFILDFALKYAQQMKEARRA